MLFCGHEETRWNLAATRDTGNGKAKVTGGKAYGLRTPQGIELGDVSPDSRLWINYVLDRTMRFRVRSTRKNRRFSSGKSPWMTFSTGRWGTPYPSRKYPTDSAEEPHFYEDNRVVLFDLAQDIGKRTDLAWRMPAETKRLPPARKTGHNKDMNRKGNT